MDKNKRTKSKTRSGKEAPAKSPARKSLKDSKKEEKGKVPPKSRSQSRSRGRPSKSKPEPVRRVSRSRSRSSNRPVTTPSKSKTSEPKSVSRGNKEPVLALRDIYAESVTTRQNINTLIRRSISREIEQNNQNEKVDTLTTSRRSQRLTVNNRKASSTPWLREETKIKLSQAVLKKEPEFGGWLGAIFILLLTPVAFGLLLLGCNREQCTLQPFHIPRNIKFYFSYESIGAVLGFIIVQTLFSILPIGRTIKLTTLTQCSMFRCNGVLSALISLSILGALWHYKIPVTWVYEKHVSLAVTAFVSSLLLSVFLYFKARNTHLANLNPFGDTTSKIYNFFVGREVHPQIFNWIYVKVVLFRVFAIGVLCLNLLLALKAYDTRKEISPTLAVSLALYSFYLLDALWFEESFATTFEAKSEAVGALNSILHLTGPFIVTVIPRFVLQYRVELSIVKLAAIVTFFFLGYFIYRASNLQKSSFRRNPLDKKFFEYDTILTKRGQKLLVSGWWGFLKHPNYLGDIILTWAWAATVGFTHVIPYSVPLLTTIILLHRAARDDARCKLRYREAWDEYTQRVPKRVIPAIY